MTDPRARLIAFYLPQFHPIPENDEWWGEGFTEWVNVSKAEPLFPGHYQPHVPAELGFYDLRKPEVRQAQADLASRYGVYGFCYYHYWFNGKILLGRPFDEVLASGRPDFPFCLCWANENWTRTWDGLDQHVLIEQKYSLEDDRDHIRWLATAFRHKNYIKINGKPLFLVYRASKIPDPHRTTSLWREEAQKMGIGDLFLCTVESLSDDRVAPSSNGFDAAVEFQPDWARLGPPSNRLNDGNSVYDYGLLVDRMLKKPASSYKRFPCVTQGWDNTARRRKNAVIFKDSTPEHYERWLRAVIGRSTPSASEENLVFLNAWNEWGEGCHLEPCQKWGHAYLEATRRALQPTDGTSPSDDSTATVSDKSVPRTKVSVCIPTFNGAKYVGEAVTSILDQTIEDFELLIVDDCSTDATEDVIQSIDDPRIKFVKNSKRLGLVGNWNKCFELSTGQYVCIFHQDDVMAPENLEEKVRALDEALSVGLVYSNVHQINAKGDLISDRWYFKPEPKDNGVQPGPVFFEALMAGPNLVCCPSVVVRRECFEKLGGFDPRLPFTADWEMWLRIALHYNVAYLIKPLVKYRRHHEMETLNFSGAKELESYYKAKALILDKYPERIANSSNLKAKLAQEHMDLALEQALRNFHQGQLDATRQYFDFAASVRDMTTGNGSESDQERWLLGVVERMQGRCGKDPHASARTRAAARRIVDDISGEELATQIPSRKIVKAIAFKIAATPGLKWLSHLRGLGKRLVGS